MRRRRHLVAALVLAMAAVVAPAHADVGDGGSEPTVDPSPSSSPSPPVSATPPTFEDVSDRVEAGTSVTEGGRIDLDLYLEHPATDGSAGEEATPSVVPVEEPATVLVHYSGLDRGGDPPCIRTLSAEVPAGTDEEVARARQRLIDAAVAELELYLATTFTPPSMCPDETPDPGFDPTPAVTFAESWAQQLPVAAPSVSGGSAVTGNRSWFDLGRPSLVDEQVVMTLGGLTVPVQLRATVSSAIDFGDGTTIVTQAAGGPWCDCAPGPDDIVHTYIDRAEEVVVTVGDTWTIVVTAGSWRHTIVHPMPQQELPFAVVEVRSSRN